MSRIAIYIVAILFSLSSLCAVEYDEVIKMARSGQYEKALQYLKKFHTSHPEDMKILSDYITVLGWAGKKEEVIKLTQNVNIAQLPDYTLEAVGKIYRDARLFDESAHIYALCLQKNKKNQNCLLARALALTDAGRARDAIAYLKKFKSYFSNKAAYYFGLGYAYEALKLYFDAMRFYQKAYELEPGNEEFATAYVRSLDLVGMPYAALDVVQKAKIPNPLIKRVQKDALAFWIRYAELHTSVYDNDPAKRFAEIDAAIERLDRFIAQGGEEAVLLQARFDRIVAYRDRFYMDRVLREYRQLKAEGVQIPPYVLNAVADANLYNKEPKQALKLYEAVLQKEPDYFGAKIGKFYAFIELFRLNDAIEWIDKVDREEPVWIDERFENKRKAATHILRAQARYYADYMDEAQDMFEKTCYVAPANIDYRVDRASFYSARGWYRRTLKELDIVQNYVPRYKDARVVRAEALFGMRSYRHSEELIEELAKFYPEDLRIQKLRRLYGIYADRYELLIRGERGSSSSNQIGSDHYRLQSRLYSKPFEYNYRVYIENILAGADLIEGNQHYIGYGAGIEYRSPNIVAEAGARYNIHKDKNSIYALLEYYAGDHWRLFGAYSSYSLDTPLRALRHDVAADKGTLRLTYRHSESRRSWIEGSRMEFDDGNIRRMLSIAHFERLISGPYYKLDATASYYTSSNTKENVAYFNPKRDRYWGVELENIMHLYRRYANSFTHVLGLSAGRYGQKGYGTYPVGSFWYEHRLRYENIFDLDYGVRRSKMYFDGSKEYDTTVYFTLDWRF